MLNPGAFAYMEQQKLPHALLARIEGQAIPLETASALELWLNQYDIKAKRQRRIITEDVLMGCLLTHQGIPANFSIVSDDAGQFNVFDHALCCGFMSNVSSIASFL